MTAEVKKAMSAGGVRRPGRRFPENARAVLVRYATEQRAGGLTTASIARELGLTVATLVAWLTPKSSFVPVTVVPVQPGGIVVRGPHGVTIEGLDVDGLGRLLRLLS